MSLRLRLTILYASLMGGVLLLFGILVYSLVSVMLVSQVDSLLQETVNEITAVISVDPSGHLSIMQFPSLDLTENVFVQVWGHDGKLNAASPNTSRLTEPMDPLGMKATRPIFRNSTVASAHLRVLSVPLQVNGRLIGLLEVGASLALIEATQQAMLIVLAITTLISIFLGGLGAWFTTGRTLAPLEMVTQAATHITNADDLSRRIPFSGPASDEVGQLIHAFNQTMVRLESLFTSQRRFLADVSHELRTPLTVIKGNVALLRRMGVTDDESLSSIEGEVDRLTRMVGDLLLLAQAESGKLPLDMAPVELDTVMLEVFQQMHVLAGDRLQLRITDIDQVLVVGDRDRLKQVLLNLVGNSIKYTPSGGKVNLSLSKTGEQARLIVQDTGPGIPSQDLPHVFERFYRAEKARTRTREGSGFGLGLSIAYWIVRNHNGRIEVDSKEGQGTTFCVWLPLAREAQG
ncbi:MAG: HAMP domain-containing sensor histidine kinase [Anaerolineaceae bacterium]|nr:HAMP domain-containing sensor histidine kinase [Anaerolineaceae bacterium]